MSHCLCIFLCLSVCLSICLCSSAEVLSPLTDSLSTVFVEFIDGVRLVTEMEADKDFPLLNDIRIHFSRFIHHLITNTPGRVDITQCCSLSVCPSVPYP